MIKLYVSGFVGNLGTKVLIEENQDELVKQFNQEFITRTNNQIGETLSKDGFNPSLIMPDKLCRDKTVSKCFAQAEQKECDRVALEIETINFRIVDFEPIEKGGVLTALWKICDRNKWGLRYSLRNIPILQGTVEIANYFDITPYRLLTKNSYIIASDVGHNDCNDKLCNLVGENTNLVGVDIIRPQVMANICKTLTYIGDITNEKKRVRIDSESEAFLTKDYKDEIDKIIPGYTKKNK